MRSSSELATLLALGITLRYFSATPSLGDVRLLVHGRVHLLPSWEHHPPERNVVARFLGVRPDELADDDALLERAHIVLQEASDFEFSAGQTGGRDWGAAYKLVPGMPLDERIAQWLAQAEKRTSRTSPRAAADAGTVSLFGGSRAYRVPVAHLSKVPEISAVVQTAEPKDEESVERDELLSLARELDGNNPDRAGLYERVGVGDFLGRFVAKNGRHSLRLVSGTTQLAVAPTGTGKSVFARLLAVHLAKRGRPVALVVPNVRDVWDESRRLRTAINNAGLSLAIQPLSSWRSLASRLGAYLGHPPKDDPDAAWAISEVGYTCHLAAYVEGDEPPEPGEEPCVSLRQRAGPGGKELKVLCPFAEDCGRFAAFRRAAKADILVVNHHALLAGRVPIEMSIDGRPGRKLTIAELVMMRAAVTVIDEIDAFQEAAIGADSRALVLSSLGRLSKCYQLLTEVERRRAENRLDASLRFERGRSALLRINHEAERLAELVNRKELAWPGGGRMTWREAHDAWLADSLFGNGDQKLEALRKLYGDEPFADDTCSEALRQALRPLGPGLGDGTRMAEVQAGIMRALESWPLNVGSLRPHQKHRSQVAQRLIVRAALLQLDRALAHLRPQLPELERHEVQQASELRDDLLGYAPWQPSPTGPLGRRLQGYAFAQRFGEQGALETRIMTGDPHGLVRELGGLVAHALAGAPRAVLGLSATCRFRGSPRADVLGEVVGWVRDEARNVAVHETAVRARISGVGSQGERMEAAREAAQELWNTTLSHYLQRKIENAGTRGRARALLVTGSYSEAAAAAAGLRVSAGKALVVRHLTRDAELHGAGPDALSRAELESFGHIPAPAVLVAPLNVVARGHNILQPGSQLSALCGIFVVTRPVPPGHDAGRFLAHVAYNAQLTPPEWQGSPSRTLEKERAMSWKRLRALQRSPSTFRYMDPELRRELICDVLVDLAQVAGRARRGGTPVDLFFVDGAFADEIVPWSGLVREVLGWWRESGWLEEMMSLHGAFVAGLAEYAGFVLPHESEPA